MPVINRIAEYYDEMKGWRQHLHAHPELDFDCHETAAFVEKHLAEIGVDEIHTGIGKTGVVALIKGKGAGKTIGLRADMDALPIQEVRDLPYKSTRPGLMHACGHDGHTTMLLGAAKYLAETRNFHGTVALIFQPAEEGGGGGAAMCQDGMMAKFDIAEVYAMHNWPNRPVGEFAMNDGAMMAASDQFEIKITGLGGHAAMPQETIDPIIVAAAMVQNLQTIVARNIDPIEQAVLSVTQIHAGDAFNVIAETAFLVGTVRSFNVAVQDRVQAALIRVVHNTAEAFGAKAETVYTKGYPPTINHRDQARFSGDVATELMGEALVDRAVKPSMGSEDFAYMLQERPGAYIYLGQGESAGLHHPEYDFNDELLPIGASFFAKLVETALVGK